jgi:hypothetical protein
MKNGSSYHRLKNAEKATKTCDAQGIPSQTGDAFSLDG